MPGQTVDVKDFLSCPNTVRAKVLELETEEPVQVKNIRLKEAFAYGCATSCDGLKQKHTERNVYDLTLHYFQTFSQSIFDASVSLISQRKLVTRPKFITRTLFVSPLPPESRESALPIPSIVLKLREHFTFVTDCANTMPNIVGSSVYSYVAPLDCSWLR